MIAHEYECMKLALAIFSRPVQHVEVDQVITAFYEAWTAVISPLNDVHRNVGKCKSRSAGHGARSENEEERLP